MGAGFTTLPGVSVDCRGIGLAEENKFPQEIDQHGIIDVIVPAHNLFVDGDYEKRIAWPEGLLRLQYAIIEFINRGCGCIRMPFLPLRA